MNLSIPCVLRFTGFCLLVFLLLQGCAEVFDLPTPLSPPRITAISPDSGAAGSTVTITGVNFSAKPEENAVKINGKVAPVTSATPTQLVATVPAHAGTGKVEVVVKSKAAEGPEFVFFETPVIASISPTSGAPGTVVTLKGQYFDTTATANTVKFGGKIAVVNLPATDTLLKVVVPADAQTGEVTLTVNGITGVGPRFTVVGTGDPVLTITSIAPASGTTGTVVTINGDNFGATVAENAVQFNGKTAVVTAASPTQLKATVPAFAGTGLVSVTVKGKTANYSQFTYVWPTPIITTLDPNTGPAGTIVALTGNNFFDGVTANNIVKFNGKVAVVNSATQTLIKAVVPADAGTGPVSVTVQGSTGTGPTFTFVDTPAPTITNYDPNSGKVGDLIAIVGTNFSAIAANNVVKFNGTAATVTQASTTLLKVTVPQGATTGAVTVTIGTKTATGPTFTVIDNSPTITSFTPASGPVGTGVTITGTNFGSDPAAAQIKFNGVLASTQQITPTSLITVVPQGAATGKITVTVNGKTGTSTTDFVVTTGSSGSMTATGSSKYGHVNHTATLLADGRVLIAGGSPQDQIYPPCEIYDPAKGTFTLTGDMKTHRADHKAFLLKSGKVLVVGGINDRNTVTTCELYDPATGQWTDAGSMAVLGVVGNSTIYRSGNAGAVMLADGRILSTGGGNYLVTDGSKAEIYDPTTNRTTLTNPMPEGVRTFHTTTLLKNGKVLVAGQDAGDDANNSVLYDPDPATNAWTTTGKLDTNRTNATAVLLPNGKVLLAGGYSYATGTGVTSCNLYDPATGTWAATGKMTKDRLNPVSLVLPNGKVLVVGGSKSEVDYELYDPTTGKWPLSGPSTNVQNGRNEPTLTLLPNGQVLIVGGSNYNTGGAIPLCELYTP